MKHKTKLQALLTSQCPRCRKGSIFTHSLFTKNFRTTHENCSSCEVKFESEPGFFWGAMYFSYMLGVGQMIIMGIIMYSIYEEPPLFQTSIIVIAVFLTFIPLNSRLSRLFMIYVAAPYREFDPKAGEKT